MTSCCCELSKLRNAGANRDRTSLPRGVRTALSPKQGGKVGEKVQPCPLNRRACLTPPLCVCYTLDKLLKCTPALQHVCCRPLREGVGRNKQPDRPDFDAVVALYARAWVEIGFGAGQQRTGKRRPLREGVGRNIQDNTVFKGKQRRPLREGVGRNSKALTEIVFILVALYARAWVEIAERQERQLREQVALYARAWVEIPLFLALYVVTLSPSTRGRG